MALTDPRPTAVVLRALGLGDLLTAVPALAALRRALPEHRLVLATQEPLRPLVGLIPWVDEMAAVRELQPLDGVPLSPDVAVNLHGKGPQSHALLAALSPRRMVGFSDAASGTQGPPWPADQHEVRRWCGLVTDAFDVTADPDELDLLLPPEASPVPGCVVIHPGAAFPSRRWPPDRFAAVARALAADHRVVVTGGPAEREVAEAVAAASGAQSLAGTTTTAELAGIVAGAALVVSGDTGVAHLASAYRTPSVVLFGPVSPALWGPPPRPQHVVLWHGDGTGDPWGSEVDPALATVTVDEVLVACGRALAARPLAVGQRGAAPA